MIEKFLILLIEDNPEDVWMIQTAFANLKKEGLDWDLIITQTLEEVETGLRAKPDLIITNLEFLSKIQLQSQSIPIIASGRAQSEEKIRKLIRRGVQEYLPKEEIEPLHLKRMILASIERYHLQQLLRDLSFTDELTTLYNRRGFLTLLKQQISLSERTQQSFYLFLIDLDHLKQINDTYGHLKGDQALKEVARCLRLAFRHHDIAARIGGDEFGVIILNASFASKEILKENIHQTLRQRPRPYQLTVSIGDVFYSSEMPLSLEELIEKADADLYAQKTKKRSSLRVNGRDGREHL